jgi:hypothetical protein
LVLGGDYMYTIKDFVEKNIAIVFSEDIEKQMQEHEVFRQACIDFGIKDAETYPMFNKERLRVLAYGLDNYGGFDYMPRTDYFKDEYNWEEIPFKMFDLEQIPTVKFIQSEFLSLMFE